MDVLQVSSRAASGWVIFPIGKFAGRVPRISVSSRSIFAILLATIARVFLFYPFLSF